MARLPEHPCVLASPLLASPGLPAGAGRPAAARDSVLTGVCLGLATTLVCIAPLQALPKRVATVFSNDPQVSEPSGMLHRAYLIVLFTLVTHSD